MGLEWRVGGAQNGVKDGIRMERRMESEWRVGWHQSGG